MGCLAREFGVTARPMDMRAGMFLGTTYTEEHWIYNE